MAIRYSGDVEIRLKWTGKVYEFSLRCPGYRTHGTLPRWKGVMAKPESYDRAAFMVIRIVGKHKKLPLSYKDGRVLIRRVFQSPCPIL